MSECGKILENKEVYRGKVFTVNDMKIKTPDGLTVQRQLVHHRPSVAALIVAQNTEDNEDTSLLIQKEYRTGLNKETWEIPAGIVEEEETPKQAVIREVEEETGIKLSDSEKVGISNIGTVNSSEGFLDEQVTVFNIVLSNSRNPNRESTKFDKDECIGSYKWVDPFDFMELVHQGELSSAPAYVVLSYLQNLVIYSY